MEIIFGIAGVLLLVALSIAILGLAHCLYTQVRDDIEDRRRKARNGGHVRK